jgi:hypothetical protein
MSPFNMMGMPKPVDPGAQPDEPMKTSGLGDTELRGIYKFTEAVNGSLGVSLPTGDIDQDFETMGNTWRAPYDKALRHRALGSARLNAHLASRTYRVGICQVRHLVILG